MNIMHIGSVAVYIERDKDGYVSLSTDGILDGNASMASIIAALKTLQTPEDREMDALVVGVSSDDAAHRRWRNIRSLQAKSR